MGLGLGLGLGIRVRVRSGSEVQMRLSLHLHTLAVVPQLVYRAYDATTHRIATRVRCCSICERCRHFFLEAVCEGWACSEEQGRIRDSDSRGEAFVCTQRAVGGRCLFECGSEVACFTFNQ